MPFFKVIYLRKGGRKKDRICNKTDQKDNKVRRNKGTDIH
jgi:hypothetical protein